MTAPVGAIVGLHYDADPGDRVEVGNVLRTPRGRCYLVTAVRRQERGKNAGRYHLRALVVDEVPPDAIVHSLVWYPRD